jgi:hypothetical protein
MPARLFWEKRQNDFREQLFDIRRRRERGRLLVLFQYFV